MKTEQEIEAMIEKIAEKDPHKDNRYLMAVRDALDWVLGDLTDEEILE